VAESGEAAPGKRNIPKFHEHLARLDREGKIHASRVYDLAHIILKSVLENYPGKFDPPEVLLAHALAVSEMIDFWPKEVLKSQMSYDIFIDALNSALPSLCHQGKPSGGRN
jgi:hypothetical protein